MIKLYTRSMAKSECYKAPLFIIMTKNKTIYLIPTADLRPKMGEVGVEKLSQLCM